MPTIYLDSTSSATATGSQEQPFKRFSSVNSLVKAGDTLVVKGEQSESFVPTNNGTAQDPITVRGEVGNRLLKSAKMAGRSYFNFQNLHFHSRLGSWFSDSESSHHFNIYNCKFDSAYANLEFTSFVGMLINGSYHNIIGNQFGLWLGGDEIQIWGDRNRLDSDFSQAAAPHGCFMVYGDYNDVGGSSERPMVVSNYLGRAGEFLGIGEGKGQGNHAHHIHAIRCGWDGKPAPAGAWSEGGVGNFGEGQVFKIGGMDLRFHDIIIRETPNVRKDVFPYAGCLHISSFVFGSSANPRPVTLARDLDLYNLLIDNNDMSALTVTKGGTTPLDMYNVLLRDSVMQNNEKALWLSQEGTWLNALHVRNNIMAGGIRRGAKTFANILEYQKAYPAQASGNRVNIPAPVPAPTPVPVPDPVVVPEVLTVQVDIRAPKGVQVNVNVTEV